jgi:hypothetical protein
MSSMSIVELISPPAGTAAAAAGLADAIDGEIEDTTAQAPVSGTPALSLASFSLSSMA